MKSFHLVCKGLVIIVALHILTSLLYYIGYDHKDIQPIAHSRIRIMDAP